MCFARFLMMPMSARELCRSQKLSSPSCPSLIDPMQRLWKKSREAQESLHIAAKLWLPGSDQPLLASGKQICCYFANQTAGPAPGELLMDHTPGCP